MGLPRPTLVLNSQTGGPKSPLSNFSQTTELTKMSKTHIWEHIGWLRNDTTNTRTTVTEAPNEWTPIEHRVRGRRAAWSLFRWWPCSIRLESKRNMMHPVTPKWNCGQTVSVRAKLCIEMCIVKLCLDFLFLSLLFVTNTEIGLTCISSIC